MSVHLKFTAKAAPIIGFTSCVIDGAKSPPGHEITSTSGAHRRSSQFSRFDTEHLI